MDAMNHRYGSPRVAPIALPRYGFGTAPLGNLYHAVSDADADAAVRTALDGGLTYIDTAPHYGLGLAETRLGRILPTLDRNALLISTKVGRRLVPRTPDQPIDGQGYVATPPLTRIWDFTAAGIRASLESSLSRLGVDHVDIVYLHDPDDHEDAVYATGYAALADMRAEGIVRAIGAGMNQSAMLSRFVRDFDLDVVLCAGRYSLLDTSAADDLFPACESRGTAVVLGGVYNSGILADPRPGVPYDYVPAAPDIVAKARGTAAVCAEFGVPLKAAAIRFPHGHPAVTTVLLSGRSAAEVTENLAMAETEVPPDLWVALQDGGLLSPSLPVPEAGSADSSPTEKRGASAC